MKYVCSKNYKILCREDCYHVKNIKEENRVWFDTIDEAINYGCKPCKHCMPEKGNKIMKFKDLEFNEDEIIQSLKDVGIELSPSDSTLGEQLQKLLQKEDEYCTLYMIVDELYSREISNNSVHQDLHGTSWDDLIDMAITLLNKIKNH